MDCFCDDNVVPAFYDKTTPRARKAHRCDECGAAIQLGEKYESVKGKWDGDFLFFKTCSRCTALREHVAAHVPCACLSHGALLDDVRDAVQNLPPAACGTGLLFEIGRLAVAIKRAPRQLQGA